MYFSFLLRLSLLAVVAPIGAYRGRVYTAGATQLEDARKGLNDDADGICRYTESGGYGPYELAEAKLVTMLETPGWVKLQEEPTQSFLKPTFTFKCPTLGNFYLIRDRCMLTVPPQLAKKVGIENTKSVLDRQVLLNLVMDGTLENAADREGPSVVTMQCYDKTYYLKASPMCVVVYGNYHKHPGKKEELPLAHVTSWLRHNYTIVTYGGQGAETQVTCGKRNFWILPKALAKGKSH